MFGRKKDDMEETAQKTTASATDATKSDDNATALKTKSQSTGSSAGSTTSTVNRRPGGTTRPNGPQPSRRESKRLIVGQDIVLTGEITSCDRLIVEGRVEAKLKECREIEIAQSGTFEGKADIELAEISGVFEGDLVARGLLIVHATGKVIGNVEYGQIEIARGGVIAGDVKAIGKETPAEKPAPAAKPETASEKPATDTPANTTAAASEPMKATGTGS